MNILIVTPYPPVLHMHGGGVRMYHNIRILAEKHSVRVLSFVMDDEELELLKSVEPICESITGIRRIPDFGAHWFSLEPFMVREFGTPAMHQAVDDAIRQKRVDVIQCEYLQMAQYKRPGVFSILTAHEAYSANAYRAFQDANDAINKVQLFSRWMSMLNYEVSMCNAFDRVVTMTADDAVYLRSYARRANIRPIPIGVDAEYFQAADESMQTGKIEVVFVGNFRHSPNVEAAQFLIDEIAPHFPDLHFVIAGSYVPDTLHRRPNTSFPGYVYDTRSLFHGPNTVFAAPLFSGTGQRVKLLEAFAMGSPVITTSLGSAGFPVTNGENAIIANNAEEFRAAVRTLLSSADVRSRLGRQGRQLILDKFTWDRIGQQFLDLVEEDFAHESRG
jgi:glycosyltransferase involved in cell wall biosynthesis